MYKVSFNKIICLSFVILYSFKRLRGHDSGQGKRIAITAVGEL